MFATKYILSLFLVMNTPFTLDNKTIHEETVYFCGGCKEYFCTLSELKRHKYDTTCKKCREYAQVIINIRVD